MRPANCEKCNSTWQVLSPPYPHDPHGTLYHYCRGDRVFAKGNEVEGGSSMAHGSSVASKMNAMRYLDEQ